LAEALLYYGWAIDVQYEFLIAAADIFSIGWLRGILAERFLVFCFTALLSKRG
jgi:hypothetical protein